MRQMATGQASLAPQIHLHECGNRGLTIGAEGATVAETNAFIEPACLDIADADLEQDGGNAAFPCRLQDGQQKGATDALPGMFRVDDHALEFRGAIGQVDQGRAAQRPPGLVTGEKDADARARQRGRREGWRKAPG